MPYALGRLAQLKIPSAERLAITGFRSARRWVANCAPGEGKYLATYERDSRAVLQSPEYLARFAGATPWTRRCLEKAVMLLLVAQDAPFETPRIPGPLQARRLVAHPGTPAHMALIELTWSEPAGLPYRDYGA